MRVARSIRGNQRGAPSHLVSGSPSGEYPCSPFATTPGNVVTQCCGSTTPTRDAGSDAGCFQLVADLPDCAIELAECQGREVCADDRGPLWIKRPCTRIASLIVDGAVATQPSGRPRFIIWNSRAKPRPSKIVGHPAVQWKGYAKFSLAGGSVEWAGSGRERYWDNI